jgi:hypothetical protein
VKGAPGVIGLNAMGDGVPGYPDGDGVDWKLPIGLGVNVPGLEAARTKQNYQSFWTEANPRHNKEDPNTFINR